MENFEEGFEVVRDLVDLQLVGGFEIVRELVV